MNDLEKKGLLKIIPIVLLTPIILGLLLNIPTGWLTIGDESAWVGFFGNYSGGIIGGIVAFIIARTHINTEKENRKSEEVEKESLAYTIIQNFLFEELRTNLSMIREAEINSLLTHSNGKLSFTQLVGGNRKFKYDIFDEIKFEIVKYMMNNSIVGETIDVYHKLKEYEKVREINKLSSLEARVYYNHFSKWKEKLGE